MSSQEVLAAVLSALETAGRTELASEVRRVFEAALAGEVESRNIAEITHTLLSSEKTYRLVFSLEVDPMSLFDPATGEILDVNDAWVALYGYSREEALAGLKVTDVSAEPETTKAAIGHAGTVKRVDVRWHRAKDGTVFPVELTCGKITIGGREAMYAAMRDITQRDSALRALERSEASFRALIENMPDGVFVHRHGAFVYMNPSARAMLGYGREEDIRGLPAIEIIHPDDRAQVIERVRLVVAHGSSAPVVEERLLRKDGTSVVAEIAAHPTVFDGEPAILAIARDVTARKALDAQLIMTDRLASLGRLSASIGHELNNPLAYVLGNVTLFERELARDDVPAQVAERLATSAQLLREGAMRMRDIVHDLKTLGRGDTDNVMPIDVAHILDVCANMADHELRTRARVVKDYRARPFVRGTEARLGQVFLNLLLNAAQAIPEGDPENNEVRIALRSLEGARVEIEISDTGAGISPEIKDRIFEPFFTTKHGAGTGLGLAVSHNIVTSAGGTIAALARPGGGALFRVVLPSADDETTAA